MYAGYAVPIIEKNVTAPLGTLISLAARDAGTFDASANTGGLSGSIRFELDEAENKRFLNAIEQLADAKKEIDAKCSQPIGWADLIALAPAGKARYAFLRDFCGYTDRFEPRWQYKSWRHHENRVRRGRGHAPPAVRVLPGTDRGHVVVPPELRLRRAPHRRPSATMRTGADADGRGQVCLVPTSASPPSGNTSNGSLQSPRCRRW